ncbi:MAG: ComEC/Rec2 family competence protein, partial [Pseudomonadota bacterium]
MRVWILAFLAGILVCQTLTELPALVWFLILIPLVLAAWRWPVLRIPLGFMLGFAWAVFRADLILSNALPETLESRDIDVTGQVVGLPENYPDRTRFEFKIETVYADGQTWSSPGRVRLNWYAVDRSSVLPGQKWQFTVRLKRPHSYMNPNGFDYESWLLQHRLRALGYVRGNGNNRLLSIDESYSIDGVRQTLTKEIHYIVGDQSVSGLVLALAVGARQQITPGQWEVMRRTGTNHLMAISGLHIGFIAFITMLIVQWLGRFIAGELPLRVPLPYIASTLALLAAGIYAVLAGFAIPTQR